jgi:hypothetical protein
MWGAICIRTFTRTSLIVSFTYRSLVRIFGIQQLDIFDINTCNPVSSIHAGELLLYIALQGVERFLLPNVDLLGQGRLLLTVRSTSSTRSPLVLQFTTIAMMKWSHLLKRYL